MKISEIVEITHTRIVEHCFSISFQIATTAAFTASTLSFSPVMESSSFCGGMLILTLVYFAVQACRRKVQKFWVCINLCKCTWMLALFAPQTKGW